MIQKLFKYTMPLALGVLVLASCTDDDTTSSRGEWNATKDYADVSFVNISKEVELDPTDDTSITLRMKRRNPDVTELRKQEALLRDSLAADTSLTAEQRESIYNAALKRDSAIVASNWPAIDVPIVITNADEDGIDTVFTVSKAHFNQGSEYGEYTVTFPKAEIGKTYSVQMAVTDPNYVSYYSDAASSTLSVTRVKWNPVGYYYDNNGNKVEGYAMYTDNLVGFLYGLPALSWPVKLEERDDNPGIYRMISPYKTYPLVTSGQAEWTGPEYNMVINATNPDKVFFSPTDYDLGFTFDAEEDGNAIIRDNAYGQLKNGAITFPEKGFYLGLTVYTGGSWGWYGNPDGAFLLIIDADEYIANTKYEAVFNELGEEGDFQWEQVFEGEFTSGKSGATGKAKVYKATCVTTTDQCDSIFAEAYGTPYVIEAPYVNGYDIYFFVKNGRVTIPNAFLEAYELQPTGLDDNMGNNIYAKINASSSYVTPNEVMLNITFQTKDGSLVYGDGNESVANITWSQVGTGIYTYWAWDGEEAEPDPDYVLSKRDDKDDIYRIEQWFYGVDLQFTWNKTTNQCHVPDQYSGLTDPKYGEVWVCDGPTYHSQLADTPVLFDPETSTFQFYLVYYCEAGIFGRDVDTFEVTFDSEGNVKGVKKAPSMLNMVSKPVAGLRKMSPWQGKTPKANKKSHKLSRITNTLDF